MKFNKNNVEDIISLTPLQQGLLFHYINEPEETHYFEQLSLRISGPFSTDIFKKAWEEIKKNNEILRSIISWKELEKPIQIILKEFTTDIKEYDFYKTNEIDQDKMIINLQQKDIAAKIDIATQPYRILICKLKKHDYKIIISFHHILFDGWSTAVLIKELFDNYQLIYNKTPESEIRKNKKTKYKEYIKFLNNQDKIQNKKFWMDYLSGFRKTTLLPFEDKINKTKSIESKNHVYIFPENIKKEIENFIKEKEITLAAFFYFIWGLLLLEYNVENDICFGTTTSGRPPEIKGVENIIGLFINTIPLRIKVTDNEKIIDILKKVDNGIKERSGFEYLSLVDIKECTEIDKKDNLFNSIIVVENYPLEKSLLSNKSFLTIKEFSMFETTHYDLTVGIKMFENLSINVIYKSYYSKEQIGMIIKKLLLIIGKVLQKNNLFMYDLNLLNTEEKNSLLKFVESNDKIKNKNEQAIENKKNPVNEVEMNLLKIWKEVLKKEEIGVDENFFDIGGNSFLLIKIHTKIEKLYPGAITGIDLFSYSTCHKLAEFILNKNINKGIKKAKLNFDMLEISGDFFIDNNFSNEDFSCSYTLDSEYLKNINVILKKDNINLFTLLYANFVYLLSKISNKNEIVIFVINSNNKLNFMRFDLNRIKNFTELFNLIKTENERLKKQDFRINEIIGLNIEKKKNFIIPLFSNHKFISRYENFTQFFDLVFSYSDDNDILLNIEYNNRLKRDKIKEIINNYIELLQIQIKSYINHNEITAKI